MKSVLFLLASAMSFLTIAQNEEPAIDLNNWKLELPTGYTASDWKLSNFQNDRFASPFFYLDSADGALVMEAYPAEGKSKAKYTRCTLREQMQPGSNDLNWTLKDGGVLEAEFQVTKMSKNAEGKYHRTLLFQVDGRTTADQTEDLEWTKPKGMPFVKVYWQNERLRIRRRIMKDESLVGDDLLLKSSWEEGPGVYSNEKIGFEKTRIRMEFKRGKIIIQINDEKPIIYKDNSVRQWYLENYFTVGNYLQSKDEGCHSIVKFYSLDVTHKKK